MARHDRGNNLFSVDAAAIPPRLADANGPLTAEIDRHLDQGRALWHAPLTAEALVTVRAFMTRTQALQKRAAAARLADGRPFSNATRAVKDWFGAHEDRLKKAHLAFHERVKAHLRRPPPLATGMVTSAGEGFAVPTVWQVDAYDIAKIDLNALAPYLTDMGIRAALRRHLAEHGPHSLTGVVYAEVMRVE